MAKRSRGRVSREPAPAPQRTQRAARRRPVRRQVEQPFFDRYRGLIIGGIALAGVLIIGFLFFQGATRAAYDCRSLLTPGPSEPVPSARPSTPAPSASPSTSASPSGSASPSASAGSPTPSGGSPSPSGASPSASVSPSASASASPSASPSPVPDPTARLGFTLSDLGAFHIADPGSTIRYDYCPPGSGDHYNIAGQAPLPPAVYPAGQERAPGFWIHNLEHGFSIVLYRCPSGQVGVGDCVTREEMAQMQQWYDSVPAPTVSSCSKKVMVVRFDQMSTDFALLAWDRALLMDEFDLDKAMLFDQQWTEHEAAPEPFSC